MRRLREVARRDFGGEGYDPDEVVYELELDMKFGGQLNVKRTSSPLLEIASEPDVIKLREAFEREYSDAYSPLGLNPEAGIEIHNFVLRGRVAQRKPELERHDRVGDDPRRPRSERGRRTGTGWVLWPPPCTSRTGPLRERDRRTGDHRGRGHHGRHRAGLALALDEYLNGVIECQPPACGEESPQAAMAEATGS